MARALKFAVVLCCVFCVLAICISPFLDLPDTSLRAYQMATLLMSCLVAAAMLTTAFAALPLTHAASFVMWEELLGSLSLSRKLSRILRC
jgi:hypothetical protein